MCRHLIALERNADVHDALERSEGNFHLVMARHVHLGGRQALPTDTHLGTLYRDAQTRARHPSDLHADANIFLGFEDIDGGLPTIAAQALAEIAEELRKRIVQLSSDRPSPRYIRRR